MSLKKILTITAVIIPIVLIALLVRSCQLHTDSLYGLKVTGDGTGGSIAIYEDTLGGDIYAQRISADGKVLWEGKGAFLGESKKDFYSFSYFHIVSDNTGGAFISWSELTGQKAFTHHVLRLDSVGRISWQKDFPNLRQMINDDAGGVIIEYISGTGENTLLFNRLDSNGDLLWGEAGIQFDHS
jgi:hypothetical protein